MTPGCATEPRTTGPYAPMTEADRRTALAERLTGEAVDVMGEDPGRAEALLRDALTADLYHGPAHNNLGVLYLRQGRLYEAAGEFEWARKLLPGHPDPRFNLALTLERGGRLDDALAMYETSTEIAPGFVPSIQAQARVLVRQGRGDARLRPLLEEIAMRGETETWRAWARKELALRAG
ncbi:MAG TPA: tetratricopeptide repeat protein [Phycisphaerales bacterium]|nr:tetratricopeptide repeat protein [Phycisphaerales bacterium]HMP37824.1 tetratricopeptide repeat protein [Phycisphaerales bacterium]